MVAASGGKLLDVTTATGKSPPLPPKLFFNTSGSARVFKPSFAGSRSYAKAAAFVVPPVAAAVDINLDLSSPLKTTTPMLPVVSSAPNIAIESRLAFLESHFSKLSVLIKSLVEPVGALVALVTKLLSTPPAMDVLVRKCVNGLAKQNKGLAAVASIMQKKITHLEKKCEWACLENASDNNDMVDDDNNDNKDFSVYDNTFNVMMHLWEDQPSSIKSSSNQTAKWMNSMVKNSHELVCIMGKMYELDIVTVVKIHLFPHCMGNYSYLPQQSEEHFAAHNRNNLDFIELNPLPSCLICFPLEEQSTETYTAYTTYYFDQAYFEDNFEERNNCINQLLYSTTFTQQPPDFEYLNHQIHIWVAAYQSTITLLETEEESYQTVPIFDLFLSKSEHSTQTVTPEPMAQDPMQANILAILQGIQTALGRKNNTPLPLFRGAPATCFSQETNAGAQQRIVRWTLANIGENNTSFTTQFENKFRTPILISKWCMELERRTQGPGEVVTEYAKAIRKFIMHLGSTLPVFAPAPVMAPTSQMAATYFAAQTQDPNEQLIDRLTANLAQLLEPLAQAVRDNQQPQRPRFENHFNQPQQPPYQRQQNRGPPVCYRCGLTGHFSRDCNNPSLSPPAPRNNDNQNNRTINNNALNQRPNHANINFFGEDPLVEATDESASQPEKNPFYAFNLTDDDHDMDELAINTSESTRKKKKAKVDFVLDPNKSSTSNADNNEPPKAKVFKNPPKLEPSEIVQKSGPYSVVKDLMETPAHITFGQLITHPQFRKDLCKSLIPKKKTPKTNKRSCQAGLADNSNVIPLICKAQVAGKETLFTFIFLIPYCHNGRGYGRTRGAAAFVTHGMEASYGIAVDGTLLSTKTETKTVLLALKANVIKAVIGEKKIDFIIKKVAAHTEVSENKKADKLAKEATAFDTVGWAYNAKYVSYVLFCRGVELDLNIRHFLSQQSGLQAALDWISNVKVQKTLESLDQEID
ncbi:hypothetical protein G9A89_014112 [Geosiphon pyriformis]|nr:hypothetical protein G9A89_014112 [Geosiphon pyriformis]